MYILKVKYYEVKYEEHTKEEAEKRFIQLSNMSKRKLTRINKITLINDKGEILEEYQEKT